MDYDSCRSNTSSGTNIIPTAGAISPPDWASQISLVVHPFDFFSSNFSSWLQAIEVGDRIMIRAVDDSSDVAYYDVFSGPTPLSFRLITQ